MTQLRTRSSFMVAGTHSGCGKTTVTLALIAALRKRGTSVQPFKVGPDFIDPGLHGRIAGLQSRNLDGWMLDRNANVALFQRFAAAADVSVVEGVMGLYDGFDGTSESGSSAEMAKWLDIPVVLVVDARSMARSVAALVMGFTYFDPGLRFAGVIFNRIGGAGHLEYLKEAMNSALPDVQVLGGLPREGAVEIPERHLGLLTAEEALLGERWAEDAAAMIESNIDVGDLLLRCSWHEPEARATVRTPTVSHNNRVKIAVARDAAFCFYYPENLELLSENGAEPVFFSPVSGDNLPGDCSGLYLGGGYPELFAEKISRNVAFLGSVRRAAAGGMPVYAECGGLMTLGKFIETGDGQRHIMARVLPFGTRMLLRRRALGYTEVVLRESCMLGPAGLTLRGHEFHYSEIVDEDDLPKVETVYEIRGRRSATSRLEGYRKGSVLASYIHLHWGSAPEAAASLVAKCRRYRASMLNGGIS